MTEGDMVSQLQNQAASADGQMQAQNTVQMSEQGRRDASDASLQRFLDSAKSVIMPNSSKHKDLF